MTRAIALFGLLLLGPGTAASRVAASSDDPFTPGTDDLRAVLEKVQPQRDSLAMVSIHKITIWRTGSEPWSEIRRKAVADGKFTPTDGDDYAVAVVLGCHQQSAAGRWLHQKLSWFLLEGNRLVAYDHYRFQNQCTVFNRYRPAVGAAVATETALLERLRRSHPPNMVNRGELYGKGLALVQVCRIDEARRLLEEADRAVDTGFRETTSRPQVDLGRKTQVATRDDVSDLRAQLALAIDRGCPDPAGG